MKTKRIALIAVAAMVAAFNVYSFVSSQQSVDAAFVDVEAIANI